MKIFENQDDKLGDRIAYSHIYTIPESLHAGGLPLQSQIDQSCYYFMTLSLL